MSVTQIAIVRRRGFTLVELLVVIAIIGVLMGLLMPAIMNARLASLQTVCANNERELAHAMILFDSDKGRLPYVGRSDNNYSWYTQILEELGQGKLAENPTNQPMKQFKCPVSDATANSFSYMANVSPGYTSKNPSPQQRGSGLLYYYNGTKADSYTKSSISSIKDGTSTTILLSEKCYKRVPGHGTISHTYSPFVTWVTLKAEDEERNINPSDEIAFKRFGLSWSGGSVASNFSNYPTSRHSQVNNMAFADGSVKAISKAIYYNTYKSLMCPDDINAGIGTINLGSDPNMQQ